MSLKMIWLRLKKDKGALLGMFLVFLTVIVAVLAPVLAPYDPEVQSLMERRAHPSLQHPFGQDIYGRDMLSRIIYGARTTLIAGVLCVLMSGIIGSFLGLYAGYYGGFVSSLIMRVMDLMMSFPVFLLAILIVSVLGPGLVNAVIAVAITTIPSYARVVRSSALALKNAPYVEAARAMGAKNGRIMLQHILPNAAASIIVMSTTGVASAIISTSALGFIGLGAQPPTAEWGLMLNEGRSFITSDPHLCMIPGLAIVLLVLGFNLFGDGLRDALDPRLK